MESPTRSVLSEGLWHVGFSGVVEPLLASTTEGRVVVVDVVDDDVEVVEVVEVGLEPSTDA